MFDMKMSFLKISKYKKKKIKNIYCKSRQFNVRGDYLTI
jgi:hypothetical protein